jgi:hypothetical protein
MGTLQMLKEILKEILTRFFGGFLTFLGLLDPKSWGRRFCSLENNTFGKTVKYVN